MLELEERAVVKIKKGWQGLHANRYSREPLERAYAAAWQKFCEGANSPGGHPDHLDYLLSTDQSHPVLTGTRDREVACTVIQWLGSTVGQQFVSDVLGAK